MAGEEKRALYVLGEKLLQYRFPVIAGVSLVTAFFGYHALQLTMITSFAELLPQSHSYIQVHRKFAGSFGGANNVMIMAEVRKGDIFTVENLTKVYQMTDAVDKVYGVNHNQIDSIGHRTTRYLQVTGGGGVEAQPIMALPPRTPEEVEEIRRRVHDTEAVYGKLVSLDDKAALIRANFIEGRLDYKRIFQEINETVSKPFADENFTIYIAGEPRLYGWVYHFANEVYIIFAATAVLAWTLLYLYFRDWRGALRPTITGLIAAIWGLGFIRLIGFALDPLALVIPFFITARAVSHSVQMHDRYYEEYRLAGWDKRKAIIGAFAELFVPTLSGILTDALGIMVILLVPILLLQKLAITASFWILAITISELLLNPIIYWYLRPPERDVVERREVGIFKRTIQSFTHAVLSPRGRVVTLVGWVLVFGVAAYFWKDLVIGDPEAATPLLWRESAYNISHSRIQERFGGMEPLIVVAEGHDKDAMKYPETLKTMEKFQRFLERDPDVGASFSLADILRGVNMAFHELEPRWGIIPNTWEDIGALFFVFFSGSPPSETAKYVDTSYSNSHVTFFCKNHKGDNIRRIIDRCKKFIAENPMDKAAFRLAGGLIGVLAAANEEILRNDILMNVLGFVTIYVILLFTYRSWTAGLYMLVPLLLSNGIVNAYMGARNIGININTLPIVTVGIGFGIDYGLYIVSRTIEEFKERGDLDKAVSGALSTAGKAVSFTAMTMILGTLFWNFSSIRFDAEMGLLLALWMFVSFLATMTLLPVLILLLKPRFILRERPGMAEERRQVASS